MEEPVIRVVYREVYDEVQITIYDDWEAIARAVSYLAEQQVDNGSFNDEWNNDWIALALAEAGVDLGDLRQGNTGKTYLEYLAEKELSTTGDLIKAILVLNAAGRDPRNFAGRNLVQELLDRQQEDGGFNAGSEMSEALAVIALVEAGESPFSPWAKAAKQRFLRPEARGKNNLWLEWGSESVDTTAAVIRALYLLGVDKEDPAIQEALETINRWQNNDGVIEITWDGVNWSPNYESTAEVVMALSQLGIDPTQSDWAKNGNNLVTALLNNQDPDSGAFLGDWGNNFPTQESIRALVSYRKAFRGGLGELPELPSGNQESGKGGGATNGSDRNESIEVAVSIIGPDGEVIFEGEVTISPDNPYGYTVLGALEATGLSYETKYDGAYVSAINGIREDLSSTAGWKYLVNGDDPPIPAREKILAGGDTVVWFYAESSEDQTPGRDKSQDPLERPLLTEEEKEIRQQIRQMARERLERILQELPHLEPSSTSPVEEVERAVVVVGLEAPIKEEEKIYLAQLLSNNKVQLEVPVKRKAENVITDAQQEVKLEIPREALEDDQVIRVEEIEDSSIAGLVFPAGYVPLSGVYEFGPSGTTFQKPAILQLKLVVPPYISPERVALAWFDEHSNRWVPVPAVLDLANGEITGLVNHFTKFAVLGEINAGFVDLTEEWEWAREAVGYLTARGVIEGLGNGEFAPGRSITRAEFIKMITKVLGLSANGLGQVPFSDVPKGAWYAPFVRAAWAAGLAKGYADFSFKPDQPLTRQEMAVILVRALQKEQAALSLSPAEQLDELSFVDQEVIAGWARPYVALALKEGFLDGMDDTRFAPKEEIERARAALVIYRLFEQINGLRRN
ncbi:S-layer protein [Calderihabitans maritimus]|uniref:S-layer protein n=2 Tax=Calderihabitans maritimus TaxID=1246530 RepID=A0A1Z5HQY7_9FIRM|nr:S-layer protein [Calderihabitans maritimus]